MPLTLAFVYFFYAFLQFAMRTLFLVAVQFFFFYFYSHPRASLGISGFTDYQWRSWSYSESPVEVPIICSVNKSQKIRKSIFNFRSHRDSNLGYWGRTVLVCARARYHLRYSVDFRSVSFFVYPREPNCESRNVHKPKKLNVVSTGCPQIVANCMHSIFFFSRQIFLASLWFEVISWSLRFSFQT